jgi:hypothetical protein
MESFSFSINDMGFYQLAGDHSIHLFLMLYIWYLKKISLSWDLDVFTHFDNDLLYNNVNINCEADSIKKT